MRIAPHHPARWLAAVAAVLAAGAAHAQQQRCLTASKFGPNDEIGNLNHVPAKTLAASKLVTRGKAYRLGIETNKDTPAYPPRTFSISEELGRTVVERSIDRTEVYLADEVFFSGTGAQITPVMRVDHRSVGTGAIGPICASLRNVYAGVARGRAPKYRSWCRPVYAEAAARATGS